jgi:FkbM family methyltransferase
MSNIRYVWRSSRNRSGSLPRSLATLARLAAWGIHTALRIPATVSIGECRAQLRLPPARRAGSTAIYVLRENYEPEFRYFAESLRPGMVVIDGGASIGIYTAVAGKVVGPTGRVLSFEPGAESFAALEENIRLNELSNTVAFHAALSDRTGTAVLYDTGGGPNSYSLGGGDVSATEVGSVETKAIDDVLMLENLEHLDLIKLDIQGAEELALRGAQNAISRFGPRIMFELRRHLPPRLGLEFEGGWRFLADRGYRFFSVGREGELIGRAEPRGGNFVAVRESGVRA